MSFPYFPVAPLPPHGRREALVTALVEESVTFLMGPGKQGYSLLSTIC